MPAYEGRSKLPGVAFKNGKLLIFWEGGVASIVGWPEPGAWRKPGEEAGWVAFRPRFQLVKPYRRRKPRAPRPAKVDPDQLSFGGLLEAASTVQAPPRPRALTTAQRRKRAFDQFRFSLPKPVAARMEKFPARQWDLLVLLNRHGTAALELASARPVVAYLLGLHSANRVLPCSEVDRLIGLKGKNLVGELGFPDSRAMVNVLDKVHPPTFSEREAVRLRRAIDRDPGLVKSLGHLPEAHGGIVAMLAEPGCAARLSQPFLQKVAEDRAERYRSATARRLREVVVLEGLLGLEPRPAQFRDPAGLLRAHELLLEMRRLRERERRRAAGTARRRRRFPPPPIPGTPDIVPVTSFRELVREGEEQDNCAATYDDDVLGGNSYIYRVLAPERCTLEIVLDDDGNWSRQQLEISSNRRAGDKARRLVDQWLERYRIGA